MIPALSSQLDQLKTNGTCTFDIGEDQFDADFPGHYHRVIRKVSLTIYTVTKDGAPPARTVPVTIPATLIQLGNKTLTRPDAKAVDYLLGTDGADQPAENVLRVNWAANQQVRFRASTLYGASLILIIFCVLRCRESLQHCKISNRRFSGMVQGGSERGCINALNFS